MNPEEAIQLRRPFPKSAIQTLPVGGVQLAYVGHAAVTQRLLEVDPNWNWEPLAFDTNGLPTFDEFGGLWIKLTICGITRYGYGEPQGRDHFDKTKGAIGNAIRTAAMRFGVALDLWAKGDITSTSPEVEPDEDEGKPEATDDDLTRWAEEIRAAKFKQHLIAVSEDISGHRVDSQKRYELRQLWVEKYNDTPPLKQEIVVMQ